VSERVERGNINTVTQTPPSPISMSSGESGMPRVYSVGGADCENISVITDDISFDRKILWRNSNAIKPEMSL